ncbi:MAG: glycosyltransferase [Lachnospiraceae bacterium]|nr:glycosyltransferase [Lachnospiraceae bacterium]
MKRVLIPHTRELCYLSGMFFLDRIQATLEEMGVVVDRVDFETKGADYSSLEQFIGTHYDGIIDMNSILPFLILDDDSYWLDRMEAPFFNYIVDHPLYHHDGLHFPVKREMAIGIDRCHCAYMRKHYPHLADVFFWPLPGTKAMGEEIPYEKREHTLLFSGTYDSEVEQDRKVASRIAGITDAMKACIRQLQECWDPAEMPLETALEQWMYQMGMKEAVDDMESPLWKELEAEYGAHSFAHWMTHLYLLDMRKRNAVRREIVEAVAQSGLPISIMGEGWELLPIAKQKNVRLVPPCPMGVSFEVMQNSKMILDVTPLFFQGFHDRVASGLLNGCLTISNMRHMEGTPQDGVEMLYYQQHGMEDLLETLHRMDEARAMEIAEAGRRFGEAHCTFEQLGERIYQQL